MTSFARSDTQTRRTTFRVMPLATFFLRLSISFLLF